MEIGSGNKVAHSRCEAFTQTSVTSYWLDSPWGTTFGENRNTNISFKKTLLNMSFANLWSCLSTLRWRQKEGNVVSNHQPHNCLLNRLVSRWSVNSPHKGPVTRKCFHLMTSSLTIMSWFHQMYYSWQQWKLPMQLATCVNAIAKRCEFNKIHFYLGVPDEC